MKKLLTHGLLHLVFLILYSQSSKVEAQSTEIRPGIILPQMTTAQRTAIASPQNGMLVFDTNTQSYWFRQSGTWVNLTAGGSESSYWQLSGVGGNEIKNTNTGGFWSANPTVLDIFTSNPPTAPVNGSGTRLMWIPSRSAFRVGTVGGSGSSYWDASNIGLFSFASGFNTRASSGFSTAIGYHTTAGGPTSTAMGYYTTANGDYSTAAGYNTTASNYGSTAMGEYTIASGSASTAMGRYTTASGSASTAMGSNTVASGDHSTAMGNKVNTNSKYGSFIIGDADSWDHGTTFVGFPNQFVARFSNGYYLMTCGNAGNNYPPDNVRTGIWAGAGANAWSAISDSTKKEKHQLIDGEGLLHKIAQFKLTTWNYKGQDPKTFRHYGPMAQDFYAAFGKDSYGTIGCDTLINQADFDGINFTAIQALVKRTNELRVKSDELKAMNGDLSIKSDELRAMNEALRSINDELRLKNEALDDRLAKMEKEWTELRQLLVSRTTATNTASAK